VTGPSTTLSGGAAVRSDTPVPSALRLLDGLLEFVVGASLLAELAVVILDVTCRTLFGSPLLWAGDVATLALTVIAFIGGAVAYRHDHHICVRTIVDMLPPRPRRGAYAAVEWLVMEVTAIAAWQSIAVVQSRWDMLTPVLEIRGSWLVLPLSIGLVLLILFALIRLAGQSRVAVVDGFIGVVACTLIVVALHAMQGANPRPSLAIAMSTATVLATVLLGLPIAFSLILGTTLFLYFGTFGLMVALPQNIADGVGSYVLLALPFFILAGLVMEGGGISRRLVLFITSLVGRLRGGLLHVTVVSMYIVSGISGSKSADVAAVGLVMRDMLDDEGYDRAEAAAVLAASAAMGECVPPSIAMLVLGSITSLSMGALFIAGLMPAAVIALCLMVLIYFRSSRFHVKKHVGVGFLAAARLGLRALIPFSMLIMLFAGILSGVATPTEVSAFAVGYGLLISVVLYREINLTGFRRIVADSICTAGMVLFALAAAQSFSWSLSAAQLPQALVALVSNLHGNTALFLAISVVALILLGALLEGLPALLILAPLFLPLAQAMGVNSLHYGILLLIAMGIGAFLPPIAVGFFISCVMVRAPVSRASRLMISYVVVLLIGLMIVTFVPWFTLLLPRAFGLAN
jgi:tripartite ATP-independent transporter DctM subunit